jgi:putative peptidoglycan lipid II flippase
VAVLYFAYRLIQFPIGIFSNALAQAILPVFSVQAIEENRQGLIRTLSWGLRATFFLMLPVSAGFIALGKPIVSTLFQGGRFDINSVNLTAAALLFYSIGLFAYGATKVLQSCFFALKDTITPAKISAIALVMNIILNSLLMFPLKIAGLALATSVSAITAFIILLILLKRKLGNFNTREIVISFARILAASVLMGVVCHFISRYPVVVLNKYIQLGLLILSGFISYVVFCHILRVSEMQQLWNWLMQRFGFSATR